MVLNESVFFTVDVDVVAVVLRQHLIGCCEHCVYFSSWKPLKNAFKGSGITSIYI